MKTVARYFIGVDLHQKVLQFCVVDRQGEMVCEKGVRIPCQPYDERVFEEFARWRGSCRLAVEAVGMNRCDWQTSAVPISTGADEPRCCHQNRP
jgi:hypothetical protein